MRTKETSEDDKMNKYETELTSPTDILEDVKKYLIKDGKVFFKRNWPRRT